MSATDTVPPQIEDVLALSPLQEGLFSLSQLTGDGIDLYTMQFVVDIDGPVDVARLRASTQAMLGRHPNLRVSFWDTDVPKPVQVVPDRAELPWSERAAMPAEFPGIAEAERRRPFDLSHGPALRFVLLTVPDATPPRRRMILTAHHILMDGWAVAVFFTELLAVYQAGGTTDSLPAPRPYRDYIGWLAAQDSAAAMRRWADYLGDLSGPLMIAEGSSVAAGVPEKTRLLLPANDTARLRQWAGAHGLTLNTAVQFAWTVVLGRLTDRRDVVFGTIISGRPEQLAGVEGMVGLFINTVPVAHRLERSATVVEQCARLQRESAAMRDAGYLSLSSVQRTVGHGALFDTLFVFENAPIGDAIHTVTTPDGACFRPIEMESLAHYPLTVVSHLSEDELVVLVEAIPAALPHLSCAEIGERLLSVLRQLPDIGDATPDALDLLSASERAEFRTAATDSVAQAESTVWEQFERQVDSTPEASALTVATGERYTYRELHAAASRLGREFAEHGVGPETVVALVLPRSAQSVVAILATYAAGAAYVPVDISLPATRIASIMRQAQPVLAVALDSCRHLLAGQSIDTLVLDDPTAAERISRQPAVAPAVPRHPSHSAYLIFTSGSTGEPKGVIGTNAALTGYFADHRDRVYRPAMARLGRPLRIAHAWSLSFDASWQPMVGLLAGQAIHLFGTDAMRDAHLLVEGMARHDIDMIDTTPSMFAQLSAAGLLDRELRVLALGGEAIDTALWSRLRELTGTAVYNCYGPTETTVEAVVAAVAATETPTIGTPTAGMYGYVLDSMLRPVPRGVVGELYLSGVQLARGYVGRAAITADRFVADPLRPGCRMYRTGDLVRRLPHGGLGYLGRADAQVKVRGYRIEIGEIETALRGLSGVDTAAVTVVRRAGGASLVGFVVGQPNRPVDPSRIRAELTECLPAYMIPARIIALDLLPVNANGKLDGHELARLAERALSGGATGAAAATSTERALSEVFSDVFGGQHLGVDDDLFALGMDSIVAISLVNTLRRAGIVVSAAMVMTHPTVRSLAEAIDARAAVADSATDRIAEYGAVSPTPVISWLSEYGGFRRLALPLLISLPDDVDRLRLESVLQALLDGHDMLRARLVAAPDGHLVETRAPGSVRAAEVLSRTRVDGDFGAILAEHARAAIDRIDPFASAMIQAVWFERADAPDVLLMYIHHLAVDPISLQIVIADLADAWAQVNDRRVSVATPAIPAEFTGYRRWAELLHERRTAPEVLAQQKFWVEQLSGADSVLGSRHPDPGTDTWASYRITPTFTTTTMTRRVLDGLGGDLGMQEFLLTVLAIALSTLRSERGDDPAEGALVALEGHGREDVSVDSEVDTSRTVGWFTSIYPLRVGVGRDLDVDRAEADPLVVLDLLKDVAIQTNSVPNKGLDYGLLRYGDAAPGLAGARDPQIMLDYLGRMDLATDRAGGSADWTPILDLSLHQHLPVASEPDMPLRYALDLVVATYPAAAGPQLATLLRWSDVLFDNRDIERFAEIWQRAVGAVGAALDVG
ncbi:amino acid adenylation domain-containing protein [Nocardia sp. NBC_01499]|uniref:amino acid adenylation domain-containing protein n=1 Tax=Nocardia sp. NBC_01499 TaxID=2903597 RepID=UPI00386A3ACE